MPRPFSVYKRKPNLVDLILDHVPGTRFYKFESATNFDGSFTTMAQIPFTGFSSASVKADPAFCNTREDKVRFRFNPVDYSLSDGDIFFLRITPIDWAGVSGTVGQMQMVIPYGTQPNRPVVLSGVAPQGAAIANSTVIHLPSQVIGAQVQVTTGSPLFISFEDEGDEFQVTTSGPGLDNNFPSFSTIRLRGGGGTSTFSALFSLRNNGFT